MKVYFMTILLTYLASGLIYAQESVIKKIIYDDLYTLDNTYEDCIIQSNQEKWLITGKDTFKHKHTRQTLRDSSESRVSIIQIDSSLGFYFVEVKFDLISGFHHFNLFKNTFKYVLYKSRGKFYRVNGFLISDILLISEPPNLIKSGAKINGPTFMFVKHFKKRNTIKISKYLFVSILLELNNYGYDYHYEPYVKDIICKGDL